MNDWNDMLDPTIRESRIRELEDEERQIHDAMRELGKEIKEVFVSMDMCRAHSGGDPASTAHFTKFCYPVVKFRVGKPGSMHYLVRPSRDSRRYLCIHLVEEKDGRADWRISIPEDRQQEVLELDGRRRVLNLRSLFVRYQIRRLQEFSKQEEVYGALSDHTDSS